MNLILETNRLILRQYTGEDADGFFRLNSDPEVMRYVPDRLLKSLEEAREILISHPIADYKQHGYGRCACIVKSTGENIGFCGLKYLPQIGGVDLGFRFLPANWSKGFATEAARASVKYGFKTLNLDEIVGLAEPENHGSIRVLEKVGMQFTGVVRLFGLQMRRYLIRGESNTSY
jgi:ribosomal-protein-alanine N-acetyltransferase